MAGNLRASVLGDRLVTEDDTGDLDLLLDPPATMIGKARIVVPDNPRPVEARCEAPQELARVRREAVAAKIVMEGIAKAKDALGACPLNSGSESAQGRV